MTPPEANAASVRAGRLITSSRHSHRFDNRQSTIDNLRVVIIDGNNLLFAVRALGSRPGIGREPLLRLVERWAERTSERATIVFDGPEPTGGMARQMMSRALAVRFSGPASADDVIVRMIWGYDPATAAQVRVVSSDKAIQLEARLRHCNYLTSESFVQELYADPASARETPASEDEPAKPTAPTADEVERWLDEFQADDIDLGDYGPFQR